MSRIDALAETAERWSDPDAQPRHDAVRDTLHADNSFTAEATTFVINQLMSCLSREALSEHAELLGEIDADGEERLTVVIEHGADGPVSGLREAIAGVLMGARVRSVVPPESQAILPAFYNTLREMAVEADGVDVACVASVEALSNEFPPEERAAQEESAQEESAPEESASVYCISTRSGESLLKPWCVSNAFRWVEASAGYSVGIMDGSEPDEVRHNLAEDALLHEGVPERSLRIVWAPRELTPDPLLQAMADFRGVFPAHDDTPGSLEMRRAFLEAADQSHAYAAGMQFLVSRGDPEPQDGAHLRWSEYDDLEDVAAWVTEHAAEIHAIVVRPSLADRLPEALQPGPLADLGIQRMEPGHVHRPPLVTQPVRALLDAVLSGE